MTRILQRSVQPIAILTPVLFTMATFYKTRAVAALEPSLAEAFAALLWLSLIHVPLYFAPRALSQTWRVRAAVAGLLLAPTVILGAVIGSAVARWSDWSSFASAAAWGAQYVVALVSLIVHAAVFGALLWPNPPLERTATAA